MDHRNLRGARRGVAKELWRACAEVRIDSGFVDHWRELNDPLWSKRFEADQKRRMRHAPPQTAAA